MAATIDTPAPAQPETAAQLIITPMTPKDVQDFERLKKKIDKGLKDAAEALREIHDRRLYRNDYTTFEAFIEECYDHCRDWAYRKIRHLECQEKLHAVNPALDVTEKDTRELAAIGNDADQWAKAVILAENKARTSGTVRTSAMLREAVEELTGKVKQRKSKETRADKLAKEVDAIRQELQQPDTLPALVTAPTDTQAPPPETFTDTEATIEANAKTFIGQKLTSLSLPITLDQAVALLEALNVKWRTLS